MFIVGPMFIDWTEDDSDWKVNSSVLDNLAIKIDDLLETPDGLIAYFEKNFVNKLQSYENTCMFFGK